MLIRATFVLAVSSFLLGCLPAEKAPVPPQPQSNLTLGTKNVSVSECRRYYTRYGYQRSRIDRKVAGWHPGNPAIGYMRELDYHLTRALAGTGPSSNVYSLLATAAAAKAFTDPQSSYGGGGPAGPSPAYMSAAILSSVAYAYDHLRLIYDEASLEDIKAWANVLEDHVDLPFEAGMLDSRGAIASSRVAWGAASNQSQIFASGLRELRNVLANAKANDMFFETGDRRMITELREMRRAAGQAQANSLLLQFGAARMNTEVFNHVIAAASIAKLNGIDAYSWKTRSGSTIHDLVNAHVAAVFEAGRTKVSVAATALTVPEAEKTLMVMIPKGFGVHQAWVAIYLSQFSGSYDLESVKAARSLNSKMQKVDGRPYYGNNIGGPVACYWPG